ncbi:hypothetical protein Tco_0246401 [Tanacetum coccineum]
MIKSIVIESLEHLVLAKESLQPKSTYEAVATLIELELKKILIDKMDESQSYLTATEHKECYDGLIKSYNLDKSLFSTYDKVYSLKRIRKDKDKDEDPSTGSDRGLKKRKTIKDTKPTKGPKAKESHSSSSKGAKSQSKYSRKSVQSEEPEFEVTDSDMPQDQEENPGQPKGGIIHFDSTKSLTFSHEMETVKWIEVIKKHGYGYPREIEVRRADNNLYTFKEGDFPRLRINDIEYMLILIRVKDLQLGVESNQKKINVTRPETTRTNIKKRAPYTPYQDPQGFIYVDNQGRNRLMRLDELYKFSDGTLTRLRTYRL